jgi:hypothetical protein
MLSYFVIVFWLLFFNVGWLISYQDQVNCWTGFSCKISLTVVQIQWSSYYSSSSSQLFIGYLLQDFSSSHPNLVIAFLFGNYSVRVNYCKELYSALTQDRVTNFLRLSLFISLDLCLHHYWKFELSYWSIEADQLICHQVQVNSLLVISCLRFLFQSSKFGHHISDWQL